MRWMMALLAAGLVVGLTGCGSDKAAMDALREEQRRTQAQLDQLSADLSDLRKEIVDRIDDMATSVGIVTSRVDMLELSGASSAPTATRPDTGPSSGDDQTTPVEARTFEELAGKVAELEARVTELNARIVTAQEEELLRDPQETWRAMNDPEKIGWRLDRLARVWPAEEDEATRQAFQADVDALKEELNRLAAMSNDEAIVHYRAKLVERAAAEGNGRMAQWFQAQIAMLDEGQSARVGSLIDTYRRYDAVLGLKELAKKYEIDHNEMRDNGLPITGVAYGWE